MGYIIENVSGTKKHPAVATMLGQPLHLDAPPFGSGAKWETMFWQNLAPDVMVQREYQSLPPRPLQWRPASVWQASTIGTLNPSQQATTSPHKAKIGTTQPDDPTHVAPDPTNSDSIEGARARASSST